MSHHGPVTANGTPEISVVMAAFNEEATIEESVRSILTQDGIDLEFVIIDDGSTDRTGAILRDLAGSDRRVQVLSQENQGLTRSLIRGCADARAPLIARQDAGDRSLPGRLARQKAAFDDCPDLSFASCWSRFVGPEREFLYVEKGTGTAAEPRHIVDDKHPRGIIDWPTCHGSAVFRKDLYERVGGYRSVFRYTQDWDLWYRMAGAGSFVSLPDLLYEYRVSVDGISTHHRQLQDRMVKLALDLHRARLDAADESALMRRAEALCALKSGSIRRSRAEGSYFIGAMLRRNGDPRARDYFREAVRLRPLFLRAWIRLMQSP